MSKPIFGRAKIAKRTGRKDRIGYLTKKEALAARTAIDKYLESDSDRLLGIWMSERTKEYIFTPDH